MAPRGGMDRGQGPLCGASLAVRPAQRNLLGRADVTVHEGPSWHPRAGSTVRSNRASLVVHPAQLTESAGRATVTVHEGPPWHPRGPIAL